MLIRNVGHLMTNPAITLKDGSEIPEGIMDAFITTAAGLHDLNKKIQNDARVNFSLLPLSDGLSFLIKR